MGCNPETKTPFERGSELRGLYLNTSFEFTKHAKLQGQMGLIP